MHDLYRLVNGPWLDTHTIPDDRGVDGTFHALRDTAEADVRAIVEESTGLAGTLYQSFMDTDAINSAGTVPLAEDFALIDVPTITDFLPALGALDRTGVGSPLGFYVTKDSDGDNNVLYLAQSGLGLPDEAYYRDPDHADTLADYEHHIATMLAFLDDEQLGGVTPVDAARRIVLPEGDEPRTVEAAAICQSKGIARCVLLAKPEAVREVAANRGITLPEGLEIIDPDTIREQYVAPMVELRKNKGLTPGLARQALEDSVVLGTMMLQQDDVDGLVSGAVHTTANTIRPALQLIKTAPGASLVSSVFFMLMPEQVFVYGDCAVNPEPTAEELADIAIQSAESAKAFGIDPKVAMISYSTGTSGSGADVEKVKEATRLAQEKRPDLLIDGPLQYDAASVPSVGRQKAPDSKVAGQANVFVFPDLNTGNTTYKAVQRSANVLSIGPMLQGLRKPVNDLSRGALVDDIVYTIALTAIQAVQMGK